MNQETKNVFILLKGTNLDRARKVKTMDVTWKDLLMKGIEHYENKN